MPRTLLLEEMPFDPPRAGMVVWAGIHSVVRGELPAFNVQEIGFGIGRNDRNQPGLWYRVEERDLLKHDPSDWVFIWIKMNSFVQTVSILNFANYWLDNRIWHEGKLAWERPRGVPLVKEKEGDPNQPQAVLNGPQTAVGVVNLMYHIATTFPRVWPYHETGCYLLRNSFPGHEFNADILLNFFKISELITATMYGVKPKLANIQRASAELGLRQFYSDADIKRFYKVRSRDAAHDWLNVQPVEREDAVDCKLWSEAMIQYHWHVRGTQVAGPTPEPPEDRSLSGYGHPAGRTKQLGS